MYQNVIFDLDGTLLDTIRDIASAISDALKKVGVPLSYSPEETRKMLGGGADKLMHRALREYDNEEIFPKLKEAYLPLYREYQVRNTHPFDGVREMLQELKERHISMFICTNKPDLLAHEIVEATFGPDLFLEIQGQKEGMPVKPDPRIVTHFIDSYHLDSKSTLYVGDSAFDVDTAKNGGLDSVLVTWGYEVYDSKLKNRATFVIDKPLDLLKIVL